MYKKFKDPKIQDPDSLLLLSSIVLIAFCCEDYLNYAMYELKLVTSQKEKLRADEKLNIICETIRLKPDLGTAPFQSLESLLKFRNDVGHLKPINKHTVQSLLLDSPKKSKDWKCVLTFKNAAKYLKDVEKVITIIHQKANFPLEDCVIAP